MACNKNEWQKQKSTDILHSSNGIDILTNCRVLLKDTTIRIMALLKWNQQKYQREMRNEYDYQPTLQSLMTIKVLKKYLQV